MPNRTRIGRLQAWRLGASRDRVCAGRKPKADTLLFSRMGWHWAKRNLRFRGLVSDTSGLSRVGQQ